jgi:DNA-binding PadR family transcriptional regulator
MASKFIDYAIEQSQGIWRPSPGLIYPLLSRLLDENLIEDVGDGKYQLTKKGKIIAEDVHKINDVIKKQIDVLFRVGNIGHFVAMDVLEKITSMCSLMSSNVENMTKQEIQKYRDLLESEILKIDKKYFEKNGKKIKID